MTWERARNDEQKNIRIQEIVNATKRLYEKFSFDEINFSMIAKDANFTRSNLYKYFNSKEEVFLEILKNEVSLYTTDLRNSLGTDKEYSINEFIKIYMSVKLKHTILWEIVSILHTLLGKNSSLEKSTEYRIFMQETLQKSSELLCSIFPKLTVDKAYKFFVLEGSVTTGLHHVVTIPDATMGLDFENYCRNAVELLLKGILEEETNGGDL